MGPRFLLACLGILAAPSGPHSRPTLCAATNGADFPERDLEEALPPPKMELETFLDLLGGFLGAAAVLVTIFVSIDKLWSIHLTRTRQRSDRLDADAAAAVAAVNAEYVAPLRRAKVARLFNPGRLDREATVELQPPLRDETQHLARLYTGWALALKLTQEEAAEAFDRAVEYLAEDYPNHPEGELRGKVNKALQLAKGGMPGTLHNISTFIARVRPGLHACP